MNRVPVIGRNPAYIEEVELDENEVDPADITPLISGDSPIITVPALEDEGVAEADSEDSKDDEETEDVSQILRDVIADLEDSPRCHCRLEGDEKYSVPHSWGH